MLTINIENLPLSTPASSRGGVSQKFQLMKHQLEVAAVYSRQVALYSSLAARVMAIVMN